jgi:hypothetical protein
MDLMTREPRTQHQKDSPAKNLPADDYRSHPQASAPQRSSRAPWIVLGLTLGVVLSFALMVFLGARAVLRPLLGLGWNEKVTVSDSTVVRNIQQLQRLETVVYTLDQIVTEERSTILPQALVGERILMIVHGDVTAGVDLGRLRPGDVQIHGRSVKVRLVPAQIFATRIDNQKTRVYSRDAGLFTSPDPQMETNVRRRAEQQLTAAAFQDGILNNARDNAKNTVTALLRSLGFEQVEID